MNETLLHALAALPHGAEFRFVDRLTALVPVSTVSDGMGLNMTVISYRERVVFGYVACRELVPDLWDLIDDTRAAIDELAEAYGV